VRTPRTVTVATSTCPWSFPADGGQLCVILEAVQSGTRVLASRIVDGNVGMLGPLRELASIWGRFGADGLVRGRRLAASNARRETATISNRQLRGNLLHELVKTLLCKPIINSPL
jgi:hypothetical protein